MNWKPIKDAPTGGKALLFYIPGPTIGEHWQIGFAHPIDKECNRDEIMFTTPGGVLQDYEQPSHWTELTSP